MFIGGIKFGGNLPIKFVGFHDPIIQIAEDFEGITILVDLCHGFVWRLWGDGKGRFRTKGKYGAATVRGTKWLTEDRCRSTLVRVKRGKVSVRDAVKRKTVLVTKGRSYVARAKKR